MYVIDDICYAGPTGAREFFDGVWRLYLPEASDTVEGWLNG